MKLVDPCMANLPRATRNFILGHYVVSLVEGDTILSGAIRSRTLRHYVNDALDLFKLRRVRYSGINITGRLSPPSRSTRPFQNDAT